MREKGQHTRSIFLLIELLVTFLLFCFAVSVLLQVFAKGAQISARVENVGTALLKAESIAEQLKTTDGSDAALQRLFEQSGSGSTYTLYYDDRWEPASGSGLYQARITCSRDQGMLTADIAFFRKEQPLTTLQVQHYFPPQGVSP